MLKFNTISFIALSKNKSMFNIDSITWSLNIEVKVNVDVIFVNILMRIYRLRVQLVVYSLTS